MKPTVGPTKKTAPPCGPQTWYHKDGYVVCDYCFPLNSFSPGNPNSVRRGKGIYGACVFQPSATQAIARHQAVCKNKPVEVQTMDMIDDEEDSNHVCLTPHGTPLGSAQLASQQLTPLSQVTNSLRTSGQTLFCESDSEGDLNRHPQGNPCVQAVVLAMLSMNAGFVKIIDEKVRTVMYPFLRENGIKALGPKRLTSECELLSRKMRKDAYESMIGKSVLLLIDGGTINRRTLLNICIACGPQTFFWKSLRVGSLCALTVKECVQVVVADLLDHGSYPIGCISDNASAMLKAVREATEPVEEEQTDGQSGEMSDENVWTPTAIAPPRIEGFWIGVSCWAHTLQLVIGDAFKRNKIVQKAFAVVQDLGCISRSSRFKLECVQREASEPGGKPKAIIYGCDTRWNSKIRACVRILELAPFFAIACPEFKVTPDDFYAVAVTAVTLMPLAWATDSIQSDKCVITNAAAIMDSTKAHYITLLAHAPSSAARDVNEVVDDVKRSLLNRWPILNNLFVQLNAFFNPSVHDSGLTTDQVQKYVEQYWAPRKSDVELGEISRQVATALRKYSTRNLAEERNYWARHILEAPFLLRFIDDMDACVVTEGAVERSFAAEGRLFSKSRVALSEANCEHRTFVNFNSNLLSKGNSREKRPREMRSEDVTVEEWLRMVSQLDPIAPTPKYNLRSTQRQVGGQATTVRDITDIVKGTVLEVEWITDGVGEWHECVVLEKLGQKFSVFYSTKGCRKGRKGDFNPTVDTVWRFASAPAF